MKMTKFTAFNEEELRDAKDKYITLNEQILEKEAELVAVSMPIKLELKDLHKRTSMLMTQIKASGVEVTDEAVVRVDTSLGVISWVGENTGVVFKTEPLPATLFSDAGELPEDLRRYYVYKLQQSIERGFHLQLLAVRDSLPFKLFVFHVTTSYYPYYSTAEQALKKLEDFYENIVEEVAELINDNEDIKLETFDLTLKPALQELTFAQFEELLKVGEDDDFRAYLEEEADDSAQDEAEADPIAEAFDMPSPEEDQETDEVDEMEWLPRTVRPEYHNFIRVVVKANKKEQVLPDPVVLAENGRLYRMNGPNEWEEITNRWSSVTQWRYDRTVAMPEQLEVGGVSP